MKKSIIITLTILSLSINISCEKKGDFILMRYNETGCSNPWDEDSDDKISFSINDPEYENKVKIYLDQSGISVKSIKITNDGPISGFASVLRADGSIYQFTKETKTRLKNFDFTLIKKS